MKTTKLFLAIVAIMTIVSCGGGQKRAEQQNAEAPDMHTSEISLDWTGTYEGTIPCADCPGIKTVLTLNEDRTFTLTSTYIDRENGTFQNSGNFRFIDGRIIELDLGTEGKQYFWVIEGALQMLDREQRVIDGPNAHYYILTKKACCQSGENCCGGEKEGCC
jgi:uncharacterized lipoprotein NlpE involved in copper resistance